MLTINGAHFSEPLVERINYLHLVDIDLEENELVVLLAQLSENRGHEPAGSTPGGGEVHHNLRHRKNRTKDNVTTLNP